MFHEKQARDLASKVANVDTQKPVQIKPVMDTWEPKIKKFLYSARILTLPYDLKQSLFYHSRQKEKPKRGRKHILSIGGSLFLFIFPLLFQLNADDV